MAALAELAQRGEIGIRPIEASGRVGFQVDSTFTPRTAALLRPLNVLDRAGVRVDGFEALDLVFAIDEPTLQRVVAAWDRFGNTDQHRLRLEVLAGSELLERCLAHSNAPNSASSRRAVSSDSGHAWRSLRAVSPSIHCVPKPD